MTTRRGWPAAFLLAAGCRMVGGGFLSGGADDASGAEASVAGDPDAEEMPPPVFPPPWDGGDPGLPSVPGLPAVVGCSDGTREAFTDPSSWPRIAGCAGAWRVPGLLGAPGSMPHCDRQAGNSGSLPTGLGCAVADLCAPGWHVCRSAAEVDRLSPSDCESAIPSGASAFFLVAAGASVQGLCHPALDAGNDLHGCGTLGQPEAEGCPPLDRRMGFADCQATAGVWSCGTGDQHLDEANQVIKVDPALGGALCCRDPDGP